MSTEALDPNSSGAKIDSVSPLDVAQSILFSCPEILDLSPQTKSIVMGHIANASGFAALASAISSQGQNGWATKIPISSGSSVYRYALTAKTAAAVAQPLASALQATKSDPLLEGVCWTVQPQSLPPAISAFASDSSGIFADGHFGDGTGLVNGTDWTLTDIVPRNGLQVNALSFGAGAFTATLTNAFQRHLSVYVEFLDAQGSAVTPSDWQSRLPALVPVTMETATKKYLGVVPPAGLLAGIPISTGSVTITFPQPSDAVSAVLMFGGLGTGGWDPVVDPIGAILTAILDYAVPTAANAGTLTVAQLSIWFDSVLTDTTIQAEIMAAGASLATAALAQQVTAAGNIGPVLEALSPLIAPLIVNGALPTLNNSIVTALGAATLDTAALYLSWAEDTLATICGVSNLPSAPVQTLFAPATLPLPISPAMVVTITATIVPDPMHGIWPAYADHYEITLTSGGRSAVVKGQVTAGMTSNAIVVLLGSVPSGTQAVLTGAYYTAGGWQFGSSSYTIAAVTPTSGDNMAIAFAIVEVSVLITGATQYTHESNLAYDALSASHVWQTGPPPTATVSSLDCSNTGNNLCSLIGITINEPQQMLGYAWQASGQGSFCGSAASGAQMYTFQNIGVESPQSALKFTGCGLSVEPAIVYSRTEAGSWNFYVDNGLVRSIVLDDTTPFDMNQTTSWGQFIESHLDDYAVHSAGTLVGVNWTDSVMEILTLSAAPVPDANAPTAAMVGGLGSRAGLMSGPIAVDVTMDGVILVLETGNSRLQAFDRFGNPVNYFGGTTPFAALPARMAPTYRDMKVDSSGNIYLLYYTGSDPSAVDYAVDICLPDGTFAVTIPGIAADKIAVDTWRTIYALGYVTFSGPNGRTEPTVSIWIPVAPA